MTAPIHKSDMDYDLAIVGAGPTGLACAIAAGQAGLRAVILDKGCLVNSIFHYPTNMVFFTTSELLEIGGIPFTSATAKPTRLEALEYYRRVAVHFKLDLRLYERVLELRPEAHGFRIASQPAGGARREIGARCAVLATGYYDLPNLMGVEGETLPHVLHYFREAHPYAGLEVAVIGAKNFAAETALDLYRHGARVTLIHRGEGLGASIKYWVKPDIENRIKAGEIRAMWHTRVRAIEPGRLRLATADAAGGETASELAADFVFALTGYHPDFEFLEAAGVAFDDQQRPRCDPRSFESNVPGLYLGGVVVAGRNTSEIFIENGRFHGEVIVRDILRKLKSVKTETILELTTSLDDTTPQVVGYVMERALELGALDVYATPAQMKKQRPGWELTVLARPAGRRELLQMLFDETPTLGVRVRPVRRVVLARRTQRVTTPYGVIRVKYAGGHAAPEFEDCREAAKRYGVPLRKVQQAVEAETFRAEPQKSRRKRGNRKD